VLIAVLPGDGSRRCGRRGVRAPLVMMGYFNPFLRYGLARLATDAAPPVLMGYHPDLRPRRPPSATRSAAPPGWI